MKKFLLDYPFSGGYIDYWLAGDALVQVVPGDFTLMLEENELAFRQKILGDFHPTSLPFSRPPIELERLAPGFWESRPCRGDHLLETVAHAPVWQYLQRWAYVQVEAGRAGEVQVQLSTCGPLAVWLNGREVFSSAELQPLGQQARISFAFTTALKRGANHLYLLQEEVGWGPILLSAGLSLESPCLENGALKFAVQNENIYLRKAAEAIFGFSDLSQPVFTRGDQISLRTQDRMMGSITALLRICETGGGILGEVLCELAPGALTQGLHSIQLPAGPLVAHLTPPHGVYYDEKLRAERKILFQNAPFPYALAPEGNDTNRLALLVHEMARAGGVWGEMAKMALGWWERVSPDALRATLGRVSRREAGCAEDLLGLIGLVTRLGKSDHFPAELLPEIQAAITAFPYESAGGLFEMQYPPETARLVLLTCQALAGQHYARARFQAAGHSGAQERKAAEAALRRLLTQAGSCGWREGSSLLDVRMAALVHLADLCKSETLSEQAAVLLDQAAFALAQYSFQGAPAWPQLWAVPTQLKTGRLRLETAINRLWFGSGGYGLRLLGAFSLALAQNYRLPALIAEIAQDASAGVWSLERCAREEEGWEASQAIYKTPDYVLAALQDYRPGQFGGQVHPWQATLGPEALVFTNHPASLNPADGRQAGAWCGSAALPRIAQWRDTLICLYQLPADDPLGFTHAYFPVFAFDETREQKGWFFARKGSAYLAIYASTGAHRIETGDDAGCELRAAGPKIAWLVQLGRQAEDGDFADFCASVLRSPVKIDDLAVDWQTIRAERLEFAWSGPLRRAGQEQPLTGGKRFEGPFVDAAFPAATMDIGFGQQMVRLDLS